MYDYLNGTLVSSTPTKITLDVQGVGYSLFIPVSTYQQLPQIGSRIKCFVTLVIREDSHRLFGFLSLEERDLFDVLNEVSGIGPRLAVSILGHMTQNDLFIAIEQGNVKAISQVPGIGKKMAERMILELGDKLHSKGKKTPPFPPVKGILGDAISALTNLGYHPTDAQKAVQSVISSENKEIELSKLIPLALKALK